MRIVKKAGRVLSLALVLVTLLSLAVPSLAAGSKVSFDGYAGKTETHDVITIGATNLSVNEIRIANKDNCGILSTLKGGCEERNGKTVFTLTVEPNAPGKASFDYSLTYSRDGNTYSSDFRVTMNVSGPTPEPNLPVVSISASEPNKTTGVCTLTAGLSGCSKYTYQWYYNTKNSTSGAVPFGGQETTSKSEISTKASFDGKTAAYYYWFIKVWNTNGGSAVYSKSVKLMNPYSPENVTPTPTATPKAGKKLPTLTKNPTGETVTEGGTTSFIARADNCDEYEWTFVNPSGREYTPSQAKSKLSGLKYSGDTTEKLKLSNIPYSMDGWSVYCTFTNANGSIDSRAATIYVDEEYDDDDYYPIATRRPTTPTPTPYSITPVPYMTPTPTPTATPHMHSYPTDYRYDSNYHWRECECGDTTDIGTHTFDSSGMCYVCAYQDTSATASGTTGSNTKKSDPFGTIMLILGILFAAAIGVLVFVLIKEKKRKERLRRAAAAKRRRQHAQAAGKGEGTAARKPRPAREDDFDDDDDDDDDEDDDDDSPFNLFD